MSKKTDLTYEEAVARLEEIVALLETGETPLDESMVLYEEAVKLTRLCTGFLSQMEERMNQLTEQIDGSVHIEPFPGGGQA